MESRELALEKWRPNFKPRRDGIRQARVWVRLPDLPLELWEKEKIFKIVAAAGEPLFLDGWTESSSRLPFAWACVMIDIYQIICPGTRILVGDEIIWQEFIYEDLPNVCYGVGELGY